MAAIQPGVWGIDLGQCALKAIRLQEIEGVVTATAFDYVEHPKILSQPDADPDQLTREALEKFLSRNTLRGDVVCISVPGQSGLARFVKLPPVEEKKIQDIVRFEAKQQIPFNLEEVVWDYQKIGSGVVTNGFAMETEIGLFAMKRDMVNRYLQHFKDVGVDVHIVQMAPLALCNFVAFDLLGKEPGAPAEGEQEAAHTACVVALDIGADASNLIITDADRIIWQRPIPLGGNHFTRALTKDLKLTFAKAEHLKRNATKSPDLKKILAALKPVLNDFVSEVQRSLAFFTNTHRDAQIEYMVGLGNAFRLPGLQRYLAEKLSLDVRKLGKMERMVGDAVIGQQVYQENILSFAVAYGLAVQGLKRARLITNLLPGEIRIERLVKAKKPWAVAAAAALLLGSGAFLLGYHLENRPYADGRVKKAEDNSAGVAKKAKAAEDNFTRTRAAAIAEEESVKSIVAGQMERKNWIALLKFIDDALPRPDPLDPHLTNSNAYKLYMESEPDPKTHPNPRRAMSGKKAWEHLKSRLQGNKASGGEEGGSDLGLGIDDLVEVNLEAIDCRFCDDLAEFWRHVNSSKRLEREQVRPLAHFDKPPENKPGWVVELRGYTFHHKGEPFLRHTLLENLANLGVPDAGAAAASGGNAAPAAGNPTPAAAPKAGQPAAKADASQDKGPVINHISHVVLYTSQTEPTNDVAAFKVISKGVVGDLVQAATKGGGGTGGGGMGSGLPTGAGSSGGGGAGGGGTTGGATEGPSRDSWTPLLSLDLGGSAAQKPGGQATGPMHRRTEFIILFIWREDTPSDNLRGMGSPQMGAQKR